MGAVDLLGEAIDAHDALRRLRFMAEAERQYPAPFSETPPPPPPGASPSTRARLAEWFAQMGDAFDLSPQTAALAADFLDRTVYDDRVESKRARCS